MSFHDKTEISSKEDWIRLLESKELNRTNMNKLIMNYLVTGLIVFYIGKYQKLFNLHCRGIQGSSRKISTRIWSLPFSRIKFIR